MIKKIIAVLSFILLCACSMEDYNDKDADYIKQVYIVQTKVVNGFLNNKLVADNNFNSSITLYRSGVDGKLSNATAILVEDKVKFEEIKEEQLASQEDPFEALPENALTIDKEILLNRNDVQTTVAYQLNTSQLKVNTTYLVVLKIESVTGDLVINEKQRSIALTFTIEAKSQKK